MSDHPGPQEEDKWGLRLHRVLVESGVLPDQHWNELTVQQRFALKAAAVRLVKSMRKA
jgi:hypothetical protein